MRRTSATPTVVRFGRLISAGIALFSWSIGFAALTWQSQRIELTAKPDDLEAVGIFRFRNDGDKPVTITSVRPGCDCTTAELAKRTYAPGESGEIKAVYAFEGTVGAQEKNISVTTDGAANRPMVLTLHVTIPELFACTTRLMMWHMGEEPVEKSILMSSAKKIDSIEVIPAASALTISRIVPVETGWKYRIFARPKSTTTLFNAPVSLQARFADQTIRPLVVYVLVR